MLLRTLFHFPFSFFFHFLWKLILSPPVSLYFSIFWEASHKSQESVQTCIHHVIPPPNLCYTRQKDLFGAVFSNFHRVTTLEWNDRQDAAGGTYSQNTGFLTLHLPPANCKSNKFFPIVATSPGKYLENSSVQNKHHNSIIKSNSHRHHQPALQRYILSLLHYFLANFPLFLSSFAFFSTASLHISYIFFLLTSFLLSSFFFLSSLFGPRLSCPFLAPPSALRSHAPLFPPWLSVTCYSSKSVVSQRECALCLDAFYSSSQWQICLFSKEVCVCVCVRARVHARVQQSGIT